MYYLTSIFDSYILYLPRSYAVQITRYDIIICKSHGKKGWHIQTYNGMHTLRSRGVTNNNNIILLKMISTHYLILLSDPHTYSEFAFSRIKLVLL